PRPPQTESMSTPRARAASRTVVPSGTVPRRPEGVKMICGSLATGWALDGGGHGAAVHPAPADLAFRDGFAMGEDPATAVGVVAHEHVGGHDRPLEVRLHRVRDRRRHA